MAKGRLYSAITPERLEELAYLYIDDCLKGKREYATGKGAVDIKERHIPTIDYFLRIWIPLTGEPTIHRSTFYDWLAIKEESKEFNEMHKLKGDTIKKIDELFKAMATDVVANEGKGIFYAKNRLGMTDKQQISGDPEQPLFPEL